MHILCKSDNRKGKYNWKTIHFISAMDILWEESWWASSSGISAYHCTRYRVDTAFENTFSTSVLPHPLNQLAIWADHSRDVHHTVHTAAAHTSGSEWVSKILTKYPISIKDSFDLYPSLQLKYVNCIKFKKWKKQSSFRWIGMDYHHPPPQQFRIP